MVINDGQGLIYVNYFAGHWSIIHGLRSIIDDFNVIIRE